MIISRMGKASLSRVAKEWIAVIGLLAILGLLFGYNHYLSTSLFKHLVTAGVLLLIRWWHLNVANWPNDFLINSRRYSGSGFLPAFKNINHRYIIVGCHLPVLVDTTNYGNNKMFFDSVSFAEYGLQYPDSLRWKKIFKAEV